MKCVICGKENPAGVEYCEDCGAALAAANDLAAVVGDPAIAQGTEAAPTRAATPPTPMQEMFPALSTETVPPAETPPAGAPPATPAPAPLPSTDRLDSLATVPPMAANPRLVAKRYGAITTEEIPLQGERLVVGRFDPETGPVDIDLSNAPEAGQLSRHHAELYRESDGLWYVKDLGSTNGVFLKRPDSSTFGPRLTTPTVLTPGDEVAFGNARFIFKAE